MTPNSLPTREFPLSRIVGRLRAYTPPLHHEPFETIFHMQSGISLAHPWINGDSLIANLLLRDILGEDFYTLSTKAPINIPAELRLPLKQSWDSVYHSSVSLFDTDKKYLSMIYKRFDIEHVGHMDTRTRKIPLNRGFYKAGMIRLPYVPTNTVRFYMYGNRPECERLLRYVSHLGKDRSRGYGVVNSVEFHRLPEDWSLFKDGIAMRPIPIKYVQDRGVPEVAMNLNWYSPYWSHGNAAPCVVPGSGFRQVIDKDGPVSDWYGAVDGLGNA